MWSFALFLIAVLSLSSAQKSTDEILNDYRTESQKYLKECAAEMGISLSEFNEKISSTPKTRDDYCLLACVGIKRQLTDESGKPITPNVLKFIEPMKNVNKTVYDGYITIGQMCDKEVKFSTDPCENVRLQMECESKHLKELNLGIDKK